MIDVNKMSDSQMVEHSVHSGIKEQIETHLNLKNIQVLRNVETAISNASDANNKLSKRIYWLNIWITIATVVMAVVAIVDRVFPIAK